MKNWRVLSRESLTLSLSATLIRSAINVVRDRLRDRMGDPTDEWDRLAILLKKILILIAWATKRLQNGLKQGEQ